MYLYVCVFDFNSIKVRLKLEIDQKKAELKDISIP